MQERGAGEPPWIHWNISLLFCPSLPIAARVMNASPNISQREFVTIQGTDIARCSKKIRDFGISSAPKV